MGNFSSKKMYALWFLALIFICSCGPAISVTPDGTIEVRQGGRKNPAEMRFTKNADGFTFDANTGSNPGKSKEEIREEARSKLVYVGIGILVIGALVTFWLQYPTPGLCLVGTGGVLIFAHSHPWSVVIIGALIGIAAGVFYGFENAEKKLKKQNIQITEK